MTGASVLAAAAVLAAIRSRGRRGRPARRGRSATSSCPGFTPRRAADGASPPLCARFRAHQHRAASPWPPTRRAGGRAASSGSAAARLPPTPAAATPSGRRPGRRSLRRDTQRRPRAGGARSAAPPRGSRRRSWRPRRVAVAGQTRDDQRVLVRPDGARVIPERVVAALALPSVRTPQPENSSSPSRRSAVAVARSHRGAPPQQVADVGGQRRRPAASRRRARAHGSRARASRSPAHRRAARRPRPPGAGEHAVVPDLPRQPRAPAPRVVDVALNLAGRDRPARERPVGELHRVPAVLPALVDQPGGDVARSYST